MLYRKAARQAVRRQQNCGMDPRWQPHLGALQPTSAGTPEVCALLAAGWRAQAEECWISAGGPARLVALDTWHSLRDRAGFTRSRVERQQA
jgi:hypothetical protein